MKNCRVNNANPAERCNEVNKEGASRECAHIKKESGIDVELDSKGRIGELTVWVDGKLVEKKDGFIFPDKNRILNSVKQALCVLERNQLEG